MPWTLPPTARLPGTEPSSKTTTLSGNTP
jgi:hypothetical protein